MGKYQDVLIGKRGNNKGKASSLLIGNLRDKDKDGVPTGFSKWADDCEPNNKYKDGFLDTIKQTAKKVTEKAKELVKKAETAYVKADTKVGGILPGGVKPTTIKPTEPAKTTTTTKPSTSSSSSSKSSTPISLPTQTGTLPYQEKGTAYYSLTTKEFIAPPPTLTSTSTGGATTKQIIDVAQKAVQLPVDIITKPAPVTPEIIMKRTYTSAGTLPYQTRGTSTTDYLNKGAEATSLREMQKKETVELVKYNQLAKDEADKIYDKYKSQLDNDIKTGVIQNQADLDRLIKYYSDKAEKETDIKFNSISKRYEVEATEREKQRIEKLSKDLAKENRFSPENIIRTGSYFVPYYGGALFASDVYGGIKEQGVTKTGIELAKSLPVALVAGVTIGKAKGALKARKVESAIQEGSLLIKDVGRLKETEYGKIKLSNDEKLALEKYKQNDFTIKKYDVEFIPKKGLESKSPKIEGNFVEVTDSSGKIIDRIGIGNIKAEFEGKSVTKEVIAKSIAEKSGDKIKGYSEVITRQPETTFDLITGRFRTTYKKPIISKYLEDTTIIKSIEKDKGKTRLTETETITSLVSKGKYKGEPLLKDYGVVQMEEGIIARTPDYSSMTGKPTTKTTSFEIATRRKQLKKLGKIEQESGGLSRRYRLTSLFDTKGRSITTFIKEKPKKKLTYKELKELEKIKQKPTKRPSIIFSETESAIQQEYPTIVGGSGQASKYAYKEGQAVDKTAEQAVIESGGLLSKQMGVSAVSSVSKELSAPTALDLLGAVGKTEAKSVIQSPTVQTFGLMNFESVSSNTLTGEVTGEVTSEVFNTKEQTKAKTKTETSFAQPSVTFSGEEQVSLFNLGQSEIQAQRQSQRLKLKQDLKRPTGTGRGFGFGFDYIGEMDWTFDQPRETEKPKKKKKYFALSKRYGQVKVVGVSESISGARRKGEEFALSTLGASVGVATEQGKLVNLTPSAIFGQSKSKAKFLIQRRGTRLSSFGERREISLAKIGVRI